MIFKYLILYQLLEVLSRNHYVSYSFIMIFEEYKNKLDLRSSEFK